MTDAELITWADAHVPVGSSIAVAIRRVLGERDAARTLALGLAERVCTQSELLSGRAGRGNGAPEAKAAGQGVESGFGDWGALEGEPCRFCRAVGGVRFRSDDGPFGRAEVEVQCTRCGRSWAADSPAA